MSWNPLLNEPPTSVYEQLESLVAVDGARKLGAQKLVEGPVTPLQWPFVHSGDNLVHALIPLYRTKYWFVDNELYVPVEAITYCGVLALLKADGGVLARYDSGVVTLNAPTCIRCISGDAEGLRFRDTQKAAFFAKTYGMSDTRLAGVMTGRMSSKAPNLNTRMPNMQQMPRKP